MMAANGSGDMQMNHSMMHHGMLMDHGSMDHGSMDHGSMDHSVHGAHMDHAASTNNMSCMSGMGAGHHMMSVRNNHSFVNCKVVTQSLALAA